MLTIKKLTLKPLFENISLEKDKWIIIFSWPSGSWKTTLLKTIWWFIKADSWEILFNWKKIKKWQIEDKNFNLWFHFQNYNLLDLDVQTNINLPFIIWKNIKNNKWIDYLLEYFEIKNLLKKDINQISWWEKERVSIVKAFANKPSLVLLDEAGAALDERLKKKLYDFLLNYSKDNIVILITHDNNFIEQLKLNEIYNGNFKIFSN